MATSLSDYWSYFLSNWLYNSFYKWEPFKTHLEKKKFLWTNQDLHYIINFIHSRQTYFNKFICFTSDVLIQKVEFSPSKCTSQFQMIISYTDQYLKDCLVQPLHLCLLDWQRFHTFFIRLKPEKVLIWRFL